MNIGVLIFNLNYNYKKLVRKIENFNKKLNNVNISIAFNQLCLNENLLPKFTDIKTCDLTNKHQDITLSYRKKLISREIEDKRKTRDELLHDLDLAYETWNNTTDIDIELKHKIDDSLNNIIEQHLNTSTNKIIDKLSRLYGGNFKFPRPQQGFVNLSDLKLSYHQERLLNLGLNCHILKKPHNLQKRVEIEVLIDQILKLNNEKKVIIDQSLIPDLISESNKNRGYYNSKILDKELIHAAKQLKSYNHITIRKADKSTSYVLMNTLEYLQKINHLLSDTTKFKKITKNPIDDIKKQLNAITNRINNASSIIKFNKLIGDFSPGYIYGNVKTHKPDNPLRPIISQCPTPTYHIAKQLNTILTPYVPDNYCVKRSTDVIKLLKANRDSGTMASYDVESLFTNVPVDTTIQYILDRVYRDDSTPCLDIREEDLKRLLEICTKQSPFVCPAGHMYVQTDGVAMGSPLGVLFANFYMGTIENKIFKCYRKPLVYCRYIDDIFVVTKFDRDVTQLN